MKLGLTFLLVIFSIGIIGAQTTNPNYNESLAKTLGPINMV